MSGQADNPIDRQPASMEEIYAAAKLGTVQSLVRAVEVLLQAGPNLGLVAMKAARLHIMAAEGFLLVVEKAARELMPDSAIPNSEAEVKSEPGARVK